MTTPNPTATELSSLSGAWTLDPARTTVTFHTKAMWVLKVKGSLRATEGGGTLLRTEP